MTTLTPSCIILTNIDSNSGTTPTTITQPANDFFCKFSSPIYLKEGSRIALKSLEFESANEIFIDETCNVFHMFINGAGLGQVGTNYNVNPTANPINLVPGTYTIETLLEHMSNQIMAWGNTFNPPTFNDHLGIRVSLNDKGYIRWTFERVDGSGASPVLPTHFNTPTQYQLWTLQPKLANILGLSLQINNPTLGSQLKELDATSGVVQYIDADYQPYFNQSRKATSIATGTFSPCVLVELQNLRIRSMNSYIRNNVNVIAKVPLYSAPVEHYVVYEPAETIYFRTQETTITELHIRLLNIDMTLHNTTNQKPTILVLEILPIE